MGRAVLYSKYVTVDEKFKENLLSITLVLFLVLEDGERKKALSSTKRILASYLNGSRANQQNFSIILFALVDWQRKPDLPLAEKANSNEMAGVVRIGTSEQFGEYELNSSFIC